MEYPIACKAEHCDALIYRETPFCTKCWAKNFPNEQLRNMQDVQVVESLDDFRLSVKNARNASLHSYILIEGAEDARRLPHDVARAFSIKATATSRLVKAGAVGAAGVAVGAVGVALSAKGMKNNQLEDTAKRLLQESSNWKNIAAPVATGIVSTGAAYAYDSKEREGVTPHDDLSGQLYDVGFRIVANRGTYLVLQRKRTKIERIQKDINEVGDFASTTIDEVSELASTAADEIGTSVNRGVEKLKYWWNRL